MYPIRVYCCGEVIACERTVNSCETCGAEYNMDGDRMNNVFPWELDMRFVEQDDVIIVNEGMRM